MLRGILLAATLMASHATDFAERSVGWAIEELVPLPPPPPKWKPPPGCECRACACGKGCKCGGVK